MATLRIMVLLRSRQYVGMLLKHIKQNASEEMSTYMRAIVPKHLQGVPKIFLEYKAVVSAYFSY